MTENQQKLMNKLTEMFQFDQADLDFGIYRIMNFKRAEIEDFLHNHLAAQITEQLASLLSLGNAKELAELEKEIANAKKMTVSEATKAAMLSELEEKKKSLGVATDSAAVEAEIYSHLANFFSRYYDEGDFISQRMYKDGVYAIPYEGEEVKLHWANADQYYIKTSENFKNYSFKTVYGKTVHFKLVEAETERDNNKANKKRLFQLFADNPFALRDGELVINFEYKEGDKKQETYIAEAVTAFTRVAVKYMDYTDIIKVVEGKNLLEKQLKSYTARNAFDYFIHKDLAAFLNRELDFYIKTEVMFLDDIDEQSDTKMKEYITKAKVIRNIAKKIITFFAQIEDFQKKLWLKKKFVVETNYCITLDRIPEELFSEILANAEQIDEWKKLFNIEAIEKDLINPGYSELLTIDFLNHNPYLVIDTAHFPVSFKERLVDSIENLDDSLDGLLIHGDNFQALNLLQERYKEQVKCVYIDPPYNTGNDDFVYKDNYQESSWLTCLDNRIDLTKKYFDNGGTIAVSIDIKELDKIIMLLDKHLGMENRRANITIKRSSISGAKVINPGPINLSENVIVYSNNRGNWEPKQAYREKDYDDRYNNYIVNVNEHYSKWKLSTVLDEFSNYLSIPKSQIRKQLGNKFSEQLLEFVIRNADNIIQLVYLDDASISKEASEMKIMSKNKPDKIIHLERNGLSDYYFRNGKLILFYKDRLKWMGERLSPVELISDIWDDVLPNDLHNEGGVHLRKGKKPEKLINRIFESATLENDLILDYFAGSGTSGAVALKSKRKFINIESSEYFRSIILERIKNTLNGDKSGVTKLYKWTGGGIVKYLYLESYEDTLNNINMQSSGLNLISNPGVKEQYLLQYMLPKETEGSPSLLNIDLLEHPFSYCLEITRNFESENKLIDLVETFNYLIGLKVEKSYQKQGYDADFTVSKYGRLDATLKTGDTYTIKMIEGSSLIGDKILVIWRDLTGDKEKDNAVLDAYFLRKKINTRDFEFKKIYVNGDNNLLNLKGENESWKVLLIEEEMKKRMFEV